MTHAKFEVIAKLIWCTRVRRCVHEACIYKYYGADGWVLIGAEVDDLIVRGILGIRNGNIEWTKLKEGKDAEVMTTKVHEATTKYDKWSVRQMLRSVEIISTLTEFAPDDEPLVDTVMLFQTMMADHEEAILVHHMTLGLNDAGVAKAHTLVANPIHKLADNGHIVHLVHVPHMSAYAIGELTTLATAEGGATAYLCNSRVRPPGSRSRCGASSSRSTHSWSGQWRRPTGSST